MQRKTEYEMDDKCYQRQRKKLVCRLALVFTILFRDYDKQPVEGNVADR